MKTRLSVILMIAVAGCAGRGVTAAKRYDLGREIVEALARVPIDPSPRGLPKPGRPRGPLNLSEIAMVAGSWNTIGDPDLAEALASYAAGQFPGTLMECPPPDNCRPYSPTALPREGLLEFWRTPRDPPNVVTAVQNVFYRRDTGELLDPNSFGLEWLESGGREQIALDQIMYTVKVEQLEDGVWRVGKAKYTCCV
ncbi:MAG: hypothetical protein OXL34_08250 [Gemmatimonadota bacterium]|nr:hypothetical protein [Gemmatimonadota bacterium]